MKLSVKPQTPKTPNPKPYMPPEMHETASWIGLRREALKIEMFRV